MLGNQNLPNGITTYVRDPRPKGPTYQNRAFAEDILHGFYCNTFKTSLCTVQSNILILKILLIKTLVRPDTRFDRVFYGANPYASTSRAKSKRFSSPLPKIPLHHHPLSCQVSWTVPTPAPLRGEQKWHRLALFATT